MTFAHPTPLWLLLVPAALLLTSVVRRARIAALAHPKIQRARLQSSGLHFQPVDPSNCSRRPVLAALALAGLIGALARPQGAKLATPSYTQSRDVIVAVDVSRSMLAEDVSPTRLGRAQLLIRNLADELRGERLGLLPFAGTAFLQCPLSADYEIFRTFLDELGPEMIPAGGSNFAALLRTADEAFGPPDSTAPDAPPPADRYLIILSDGEAQEGSWRPLADQLSKRGVQTLALGLGTSEGAMVPGAQGGFVKDERGAVVLSRLNPTTLQELARLTNGAYRDASTWVDVPALLRDTIARGRTTRSATETTPRRQELFIWFIAPSLVLLGLALLREFPAFPRLSPLAKPPARTSPPPLARALLILLVVQFFVVSQSTLLAAPPAASPAAPPPDPLVELVGKLASAPELLPADLARLATLTAERGEQGRTGPSPGKTLPDGAVYDALAAVAAGQTSAPRAADWTGLKRRLEALLAPPPQPPDSDKSQKSDKQNDSDKSDKSGQSGSSSNSDSSNQSQDEKPDEKSGSPSPDSKQSQPEKPDDASSPSDQKSDSSSSPSETPSQADPKSPTEGDPGYNPSPKTNGEKPLGDLAKPADQDKPEADRDKPSPSPSPSDSPPPPSSEDAPTQTVGGVSASGRADDSSSAAAPNAPIDPALVVPQQRLERVRDSDAPARFFQLLQESELPPDSPERRAAASKHDW